MLDPAIAVIPEVPDDHSDQNRLAASGGFQGAGARYHRARSAGSQNTIGEIERHLVAAFQLGLDLGSGKSVLLDDADGDKSVEWNLLPPRARDVLWSINLRLGKPWSAPLRVDRIRLRF